MKILARLFFAALVMWLAACRPAAPKPTPTTEPAGAKAGSSSAPDSTQAFSLFDVAWDDRAIFRQGLVSGEQDILNRLPGASVYHIDLHISDDMALLKGRQEVRYTNQEDTPLKEIYFQLFPNIAGGKTTVSDVKADGQAVEPAYEFQDSALRVPLPAGLEPGRQVVIQMDYDIQVAQEMGGNFGLFGYFNDVLVLDEFYPVIPVYDDEGWNVKDPAPNGDVTYFDASFYLVRVTAPDKLVIVASGTQVQREQQDGSQVVTFAAGPARDFYLAASDKYTLISEKVGEVTIHSYAFAERAEHARLALQITQKSLSSFGKRFGPYPYTEFDIISSPMLALGIEYPGMTGIALDLYDPDATVSGLSSPIMMESVVAHELAHQWFYNVVGNDQVDEPWLDEAIAQYVTGLYYVDAYGEQAASSYRSSWTGRWDRVEQAAIPIGLPSGDYKGQEYGAIVYGRGPLFVAAMAEKMGQETFDEFLRDYYASHKWGIGTGSEFRRLAEKHCQCDLTALFDEWVYAR